MPSNKTSYSYTYTYFDFVKSQTCGKNRQNAYEDPDEKEPEKENKHLKYSRKNDTVTVDFGSKQVHYNLDVFIERYIEPYLNEDGTIQDNPLKLTKEKADFFLNIRLRQNNNREKINLDKKKTKGVHELAKYGITDRASYKRWCIRNHPDKVPLDQKESATELFKRISVLCVSLN
jgi:hypothetical protein